MNRDQLWARLWVERVTLGRPLGVCPTCETPARLMPSGLCVDCEARAAEGAGSPYIYAPEAF
ncbi:MAG: hypothetical protein OEO20_11380 [Gemmatimonadota bacterium]|nr:hypothetical protein [Gemmatimonadota bacterium]MDH3366506.1 hypothetical protein [Gemmatimonadota bacterium]MDH3478895.1 hypothetical protein [Gemmatimonadota bacterium]